MIHSLLTRLVQGHRTIKYPQGAPPPLSDRFRGRPLADVSRCPAGCRVCAESCPVGAISREGPLKVDLGACLFCTDCARACPEGAITFSKDFRLAARERSELVVPMNEDGPLIPEAFEKRIRGLLSRSLRLRQVSAGGCNGCEPDINVLSTIGWDWGRFGIQIVASPRHADGLIVTGPVTANMELALKKTYDAVPDPKIVIAVGSCPIAGGPWAGHPETRSGILGGVPVDLFIPGCPPHPLTILSGVLSVLGRLKTKSSAEKKSN